MSGRIYYEVNRAQSGSASTYFGVNPATCNVYISTPLYANKATDEQYDVRLDFLIFLKSSMIFQWPLTWHSL